MPGGRRSPSGSRCSGKTYRAWVSATRRGQLQDAIRANYVPDFLIRLRDPASRGDDDLLTLLLEVSGEAKKEKQAKVAAAADLIRARFLA